MSGDGDRTKVSSAGDDTLPADSTPARSSAPAIPPPPDARYRLGRELGRGGMGRVVEAFDTHLERTVALKEVLPKAGNIDRRFQREVRITARLEHASIVPLYDAGRLADGRAFYVMRRVTGKPLDEAIQRARTLEGRLALLPNALAAIDAVAHAHRRGVIHRDLKPQNILVGELGETVVIDWGLAKVIGDEDEPIHDSLEPKLPTAADSLQTQVGSVFGTPGFMPPEQARGDELGPRGDVYALGATLYQLIAGKPPFGGTSATDVIASTLRGRLEPIAKACPGAPPEIVTIIEKALAFEQKQRYADAGELAEDVRRFLTGQLVAAHRYTTRQRVARFARRHRAPLIVAALAAVGIAMLAWFSVHRILVERDTASSASIEAQRQRERADARAVDLRERADQLLVLHARSVLDDSPTQAIAVLKQLEGNGAIRAEAEAVARAAVMRGVVWGLPTLPDLTTTLEMTQDGKRVLQMTRTGALQILDLDSRRQVATATLPDGGNAMWVDHDRKILVDMMSGPPVLFDPVASTTEPLGLSNLRTWSATADGARVAAADADHRLVVLDVATKQITIVPGRPDGDRLLFAPDGSWIAYNERTDPKHQRLVVCDLTGKVLAERGGEVILLGASEGGRLVAGFVDGLYEVASLAKPVFSKLPLEPSDVRFMHAAFYRGDRLFLLGQRALMRWTGTELIRLRDFTDGAMLLREMKNGVLAVTSSDGRLYLYENGMTHGLQVPARAPGMIRIAGAPGSSRLVATSKDALLVWDIDQVFPRRIPALNNATFATDSIVVSPGGLEPEWKWFDTVSETQTAVPLSVYPGMPRGVDVNEDGRTLVIIERAADHNTAVIGSPKGAQVVIENVQFGLACLVDGGGVVYSTGKGRVFGKLGGEEARELVTLDGDVRALAPAGKLAYAALSGHGELVRGRFDGGNFSRIHLDDVAESAAIVAELDDSVLVGTGNRLLRWQTSIDEVARFTGKITWLSSTPVGTIVGLAGGEMMFLAATGDRTPHRIPAGEGAEVATERGRVASLNGRGEMEIVELPSMVTWTLPRLYSAPSMFALSRSGRRIYQVVGHDAALWTIPEPGSDFPAWLDELTNATEVDRHVHWPWQQATP